MKTELSKLEENCNLYFIQKCKSAKKTAESKTPKKKKLLSFLGLMGLSAIQEIGNFIGIQAGIYTASLFTDNNTIKSAAALVGDYLGGCTTFFSSYFYSFREEFKYSSRDFMPAEYQIMPIGLSKLIDSAVETKETSEIENLIEKINEKNKDKIYFQELNEKTNEFLDVTKEYLNSEKSEKNIKKFGKPNYKRGTIDIISQLGAGIAPTALTYALAGPLAKYLLDKGVSNFATGCWVTVVTFLGFNITFFPAYEYIKSGKLIEHGRKIKEKFSK